MSQPEPWEMEGSVSEGAVPQSSNQTDLPDNTQNWASATWASATDVQEPWESDIELKQRPQMNSLHVSARGMDLMGSLEDIHSTPSPRASPRKPGAKRPAPSGAQDNETTDDLSLWKTFKELYKERPRVKYVIIVLLILLLVSLILLVVSLSNRKSTQECSSASYSQDPFILLPEATSNRKSGAFGTSMDASSTYLIVGDPNPICIPQTTNGCAGDTVGGAAYVYRKSSSKKEHWELYSQFVLNDSTSSGDNFGASVSISEDSKTIVIGSPMDDSLGVTAGGIYVIEEPFDNGSAPLRLVPDDIGANDEFGGSVSASVTTLPAADSDGQVKVTNIVAGASSDDDFGANSGGVYVFSKFEGAPVEGSCGRQNITLNKWMQCQKLLPDDGGIFDRFGRSVHVADRTIVVGTDWDDDMGTDAGES